MAILCGMPAAQYSARSAGICATEASLQLLTLISFYNQFYC